MSVERPARTSRVSVCSLALSPFPLDRHRFSREVSTLLQTLDQGLARVFPGAAFRGANVFVKPNLNFLATAFNPYGMTDPRLVLALADLLHHYGAKRILIGEKPGQRRKSADAYRIITDHFPIPSWVEFEPIDESLRLTVDTKTRLLSPSLSLPKAYLDADIVVNLPKMKTHTLTSVSLGMKNLLGLLTDEEKMKHHSDNIHLKLVDLLSVRQPDVTIIDGVYMMEGQGPLFGTPKDLGRLILGDDTVAADAVAVTLMGGDPGSVPHLRLAALHGLGELHPDRIDLVGPEGLVPVAIQPADAHQNPCASIQLLDPEGIPPGALNAISHSLERLHVEGIQVPPTAVLAGRAAEQIPLTGVVHEVECLVLFGTILAEPPSLPGTTVISIPGDPPSAWALYEALLNLQATRPAGRTPANVQDKLIPQPPGSAFHEP